MSKMIATAAIRGARKIVERVDNKTRPTFVNPIMEKYFAAVACDFVIRGNTW